MDHNVLPYLHQLNLIQFLPLLMKLKKLFINKGVEKFKRDDIILLCKDNEVLWAAGVCLNEKLRAKTLPTHVLKIEEKNYA